MDLTSGVRRRDDGQEHAFEEFRTTGLAPGESTPARHVSIPGDLFDGLTDENHKGAFLFWVGFSGGLVRPRTA